MAGGLIPSKGLQSVGLDVKEICLLFEDAPPEPLIINVQALQEILRIARAAHFQNEFTIVQPAFFAHIPPFLQ